MPRPVVINLELLFADVVRLHGKFFLVHPRAGFFPFPRHVVRGRRLSRLPGQPHPDDLGQMPQVAAQGVGVDGGHGRGAETLED